MRRLRTQHHLIAGPDSLQGCVKAIRNFMVSRLADLRSLLSADVTDVFALRAELSKHVECITLLPDGNLLGFGKLGPAGEDFLVPGDGF